MIKDDKRYKYPLDLKLQVVAYYVKGKVGYIRTARAFNLPRDTAREWILNQDRLKEETMSKRNKKSSDKKKNTDEVNYDKIMAEFWKRYAQALEEEIAEQNKKKFELE